MQLVTPIDVPTAVRMATTSWMMYFTVSFFVIGFRWLNWLWVVGFRS